MSQARERASRRSPTRLERCCWSWAGCTSSTCSSSAASAAGRIWPIICHRSVPTSSPPYIPGRRLPKDRSRSDPESRAIEYRWSRAELRARRKRVPDWTERWPASLLEWRNYEATYRTIRSAVRALPEGSGLGCRTAEVHRDGLCSGELGRGVAALSESEPLSDVDRPHGGNGRRRGLLGS